ncbi:MAG: DEAD/DEAH box helicase family protein, partial [Symploca sp. SIO2G7]|nr:DEAD/DEAH box helicase family protein [Symploca sp. SIO2G7]
MSILTYRVTHLPDLEKTEYHVRYGDDPASRLFKMQDNFLYTLHTIANQYPLTCSLVYAYNPHELEQDKKLQIFVRVNFESSLDQKDLKQVHKIFANSFWHDFYKIEEVADSVFAELNWAKHISFGIKQEEKLLPTVKRDKAPSHYYLIQPFEPNPENDFVGFASKLEAYENRALIEVLIRPTNLLNDEQWGLENLLRALSSLTSYEVKTSEISGKVIEQPIDPVAERALRQFEDLREDIQSQRLYEVSIRILAENQFNASLLLNEFWVESSQKPLYREIGIDQEDARFSQAIESVKKGTRFSQAIWVEYWNKLPENSPLMKLARLHRLFTVEEVKACFRVVVPDPVVVFSGIPKETDLKSQESDKSILLGWQAGKPKNQGQALLKSLNKHVFICGVPGSGKTTAVLNLLFQLWTEHSIPFLVIEPAKTEYRSMFKCTYDEAALSKDNDPTTHAYIKARNVPDAIAKMQADLQIFSLGNERVCPFRFNPFAFYGKTTLDEHISTLEACFRAAMPLFGPLPALLAEAIEQVYALFGWQPQDRAEDGLKQGREFPNMQDLYEAITTILETKQYSSDVAGDIKTALEVRIGGLLRRSVGSMLNTRTSVPGIGSLLERPVILEMDSLNEEQANLMTMFILATLRQYARITRKSGSLLKHVVVIEEAHNIVGTDAKGAAEEGASNPKAEATKYIVRMLAEMRA